MRWVWRLARLKTLPLDVTWGGEEEGEGVGPLVRIEPAVGSFFYVPFAVVQGMDG